MADIAFADPPYPGQSAKHYAWHPDYAGEVDHAELANKLHEYDGWILNTASTTLHYALDCLRDAGHADYRIMAWVKPFAAFKRNVSVAYAWEPVIVKAARKPEVSGRMVMRDFMAEGITMKRGLSGAKPERLCHWLFEVVGADRSDTLHDLFPGSGAVSRAWESWRMQLPMTALDVMETIAMELDEKVNPTPDAGPTHGPGRLVLWAIQNGHLQHMSNR